MKKKRCDSAEKKTKGVFLAVCALPGSANEIMLKISGLLIMGDKGCQIYGSYQHTELQRVALSSRGRKTSTDISKSFDVLTHRARLIFAEA